jgi:Chaperone of endosialidase
MTTLHLRKSIGRSPLRRGYLLIAVALCCFGLAPAVQAVSPPPDGGYPGFNTAEGTDALQSNTTGSSNTAIGFEALFSNTTGTDNTAIGDHALASNTTGSSNTATGVAALQSNTTGNVNTANGAFALQNNTGGGNIALGFLAGQNLTTGSNNIDIGNAGLAAEANTIRIGVQETQTKTFIAGIQGTGVSGMAVKISASGQLGVMPSSARFKQDIQAMGEASNALLALTPVTFRYKHQIDPDGIPQFGLVAEEVEKVNPDLVVRDAKGKVFTVRYDAVNAMLLNEFLKEHQTVQQLKKQVAELTAGLQKVSAQLELNKAAPQTVLNDR